MALFNTKDLGDKLNSAKKKIGDVVSDAKLDEKFEKVKSDVSKSMAETKEKNAEEKALRDEAKAPVEGAIIRYTVIHLGGFPNKPTKKMDSLALGFNVMEESFIFKPELLAKRQWFGEENVVVPYNKVRKFEIVKRQISTTEYMMSSNGNAQALEQPNNINITYLDDDGDEVMLRVEMLTGTTVYGQAEKCRELMDLLREKKILKKFLGEESASAKQESGDDILAQLEKLASLKEKGIISEDEYNAKKGALLERL